MRALAIDALDTIVVNDNSSGRVGDLVGYKNDPLFDGWVEQLCSGPHPVALNFSIPMVPVDLVNFAKGAVFTAYYHSSFTREEPTHTVDGFAPDFNTGPRSPIEKPSQIPTRRTEL